jgi:hypothetical protein
MGYYQGIDSCRKRGGPPRATEQKPSAGIIDSQTVKTAGPALDTGYDGGKKIKGRKRHIVVDVLGLLHHVTRGEHDAVKAMLKKEMSLIFKRGVITDCSGREFENVSSFEYALWALDKHMWTAMIACIPQNEEGRKVFAQLVNQYNKVNTIGVIYKLNGKTITEQHFDFNNTLIKELQTQVDSINAPGVKNWDAIDKQWREGVGGAQNRLPIHIVDEYCSNEPFYPVPKFTSQPKSSKQFYYWATQKDENWFNDDSKFDDSKLSVDFAIYKGGLAWTAAAARGGPARASRAKSWRWGARSPRFGCHDGIMYSKNKRFCRSQIAT